MKDNLDTFDGKDAYDRICNLIINHTIYTYEGRFKLLKFMLDNKKKLL